MLVTEHDNKKTALEALFPTKAKWTFPENQLCCIVSRKSWNVICLTPEHYIAPLLKIGIKWRLQKWCSGASQIKNHERRSFYVFSESRRTWIGWHQKSTYENSNKMTTSKVMRWFLPNDMFMKSIFSQIIKNGNMIFGEHQVLQTEPNNKNNIMAGRRFTETR